MVTWFIKADLSNGYRQFRARPVGWRFQVYCNGPDEQYIDLACPFGKTNSSLEFCPPLRLFADSVALRTECVLSRNFYVKMLLASLYFNQKKSKITLPANSQLILGRRFNSVTKRVNTQHNPRE